MASTHHPKDYHLKCNDSSIIESLKFNNKKSDRKNTIAKKLYDELDPLI